ncbi:MAG: hypothetical protein Kapaf2KO_17510 [Candidatus Kapaibacteriales bacterium]
MNNQASENKKRSFIKSALATVGFAAIARPASMFSKKQNNDAIQKGDGKLSVTLNSNAVARRSAR